MFEYHAYRIKPTVTRNVRSLIYDCKQQTFKKTIENLCSAEPIHYLIPDLTDETFKDAGFECLHIFNVLDESERIETTLNSESIKIGIIAPTGCITDVQLEAWISLTENILQRYPIAPENIFGYLDIKYLADDDFPYIPWYELYLNDIGAWYNDVDKKYFEEKLTVSKPPTKDEVLHQFRYYGYSVPDNLDDKGMTRLIKAFQAHFRPNKQNGEPDSETLAILQALNKKYKWWS